MALMEAFLRNQLLNVCRGRYNARIRVMDIPQRPQGARQPRHDFVEVDGETLSYISNPDSHVGVYIAQSPLVPEENYFEIEVVSVGKSSSIAVGLVPYMYPLDAHPGMHPFSIGYHADDGRMYKGDGLGRVFGPTCNAGDRMGVGIKFSTVDGEVSQPQTARVFFTRNGKELGAVQIPVPPGGLHPAVGMHSKGEEVRLVPDAHWAWDEVIMMAVDNGEEEWARLHDVLLNGSILEYAGRGKSIHDVGLAQARFPLDTTHHYFELEVIDPGENCYIAIGLARKNYPKHRHPGWNRGSIAYHADDGKLFAGCGAGDPFGPRCHKGDIMGCGILFPHDYDSEVDSDLSREEPGDALDVADSASDSEDDEDDDIDWDGRRRAKEDSGTRVEIFFTRNGKVIGMHKVAIPKGGFYPTVGMLSSSEKVRVDLRPLTG